MDEDYPKPLAELAWNNREIVLYLVKPTGLDRTMNHPEVGRERLKWSWGHDVALTCPTPPRTGQTHRLPPIPAPPNPRLCPRHKSIVYKGCTLGVRGVRTGCTMSKSVGIRRASGVHPLYTVLRAHEYGLAGQQMEGLVAPAPF